MSVTLPLDILRAFQVRLRASSQDGRLGFDISPHSLHSKGISPPANGAPIILSFTPFEDDMGHGLSVEAITVGQTQSTANHRPQSFYGSSDDHYSTGDSFGLASGQQDSVVSDNALAQLSDSHGALATPPLTPVYSASSPPFSDSLLALLQSPVAVAQENAASAFAPRPSNNLLVNASSFGSAFDEQFLSAATTDPLQFHQVFFEDTPLSSVADLLPPISPQMQYASPFLSSEQDNAVSMGVIDTPGSSPTPFGRSNDATSPSEHATTSSSLPGQGEDYTFACTTAGVDGRVTKPRHGANKRPRRLACSDPSCPRRFTTEYTRRVHERTHGNQPRSVIACSMGCTETFSRQHDRLRHEVAKHGKVCEHVCGSCGHFFSSDRQLHIHVGKCRGEARRGRWSVKNKEQ